MLILQQTGMGWSYKSMHTVRWKFYLYNWYNFEAIYITGIILKQLISFMHILFNYICQNRIFVSSKLICPSTIQCFSATSFSVMYIMPPISVNHRMKLFMKLIMAQWLPVLYTAEILLWGLLWTARLVTCCWSFCARLVFKTNLSSCVTT